MITTVDVETSWQKTETGGYDPSPFHEDNILVSVGLNSYFGDEYYFTNHSERIDEGCYHKIQETLDKINVSGTYARTDEKLRQIYTSVREIAKRRDCAVIAISQASADAHNRNSISFDQMENSKTGKAAEADLIIGIGRNANTDLENKVRTLCVSKNKING